MEQPETTSEVEVFDFPVKEDLVDHYEIMTLFVGSYTDEEAVAVFEEVKKIIESFQGEITQEEFLGSRTLAYTIAHSRNGFYGVAEFNLQKKELAALNEKLRINKKVTRYLIVKKREKSAEELAEEERVQRKIEARKQKRYMEAQAEQQAEAEKKKEEEKKSVRKVKATLAPKPEKKEEAEVSPEKKEDRLQSIDDIDEEIEKLLSNDIDI